MDRLRHPAERDGAKLYALDTALPDLDAPDKSTLENAMRGHVLAQGTLMGTYAKRSR